MDLQRKRIALTMRLDEQPGEAPARRNSGSAAPAANGRDQQKRGASPKPAARPSSNSAGNSAMMDALAAAMGKKH